MYVCVCCMCICCMYVCVYVRMFVTCMWYVCIFIHLFVCLFVGRYKCYIILNNQLIHKSAIMFLSITLQVRRACDVNLVSTSRKTAVLYCLCTEYPLQHDQGRRMGGAHKLACLHVLVRAKADVNWSDREGFTALHYAVKTGSLECVRLLVDENCDLNRHAFFGQVSPQKLRTVLCRGDRDTPVTAFLLSVYYGDVDVTRLLVQHGCVYHDCQFVLPYLTIQGAMYRYLVGAFREVRSLRTLCVMTIRQSVGADVNYKAGRLNLPDVLQKAVCDPLKI